VQYSKKLNELQIILPFLESLDSRIGYAPQVSADSEV
jgi:hypothetical protein